GIVAVAGGGDARSRDRGGEDAAAVALRLHRLQAGLEGQEHALEGDGQHLVPLGRIDVGDHREGVDAGGLDQGVDAAEARQRGLHDRLVVGRATDVHAEGHGLGTGREAGGGGLALGLQGVGDDQPGALLGEHLGDAGADAAGGADDDGGLVLQAVGHGGPRNYRFCKTTLWIKKSGFVFKDMTITSFGPIRVRERRLATPLCWFCALKYASSPTAAGAAIPLDYSPVKNSSREPSLNRDKRKALGPTIGGRPVTMSAMSRPAPGPMPKPWPEKPAAMWRPGRLSTADMTGMASGVASMAPAQLWRMAAPLKA